MNPQKFKQLLEKLERRTPRTAEVLWMVLDGHTDAHIAQSLSIHPGTVRKHIEKIYATFGIKGEFEGDRRSRRGKLAALFAEYKPKEISDCPSAVTDVVSEEQERLNPDSLPHLVSSSAKRGESLIALAARMLHQFDFSPLHLSSTRAVEGEEDLMSLATQMLEQFGFNRKFKVSRAFQHVGYRLKNAKKEVNLHQLILSQRKDGLCISIRKDILDPHLLNLKYWEYTDVLAEADLFTKARFLVLPSKKEIFLESLHSNYWSVLKGQTEGSFYLNDVDDDGYGSGPVIPSSLLDEFSPNTLSNTSSYLVLSEDQRFPDTWQVCICSLEVLEEFIGHLADQILMAN